MIKTLENKYLKIKVKHQGAELTSLVKKETGMEYLWQADPTFWGRHAPVLFPIIGRLKEDQFVVGERKFTMKQHGLARNMEFRMVKRNKASLTFELTNSADTLIQYPYVFRLRIQYVLYENLFMTVYEVYNPSENPIYFSIGGHPAFRCPLNEGEKRSDYQLVFEYLEIAQTQRLDGGIRNGTTELIIDNDKKLPITDNLFDEDALIFKQLASEKVTLQKGETPIWTFDFKDFPYLGIWSKNRESSFVCIEPWFGIADKKSHNHQFTTKEGIIKLDGGKTFDCIYTVEIH